MRYGSPVAQHLGPGALPALSGLPSSGLRTGPICVHDPFTGFHPRSFRLMREEKPVGKVWG